MIEVYVIQKEGKYWNPNYGFVPNIANALQFSTKQQAVDEIENDKAGRMIFTNILTINVRA